MAAAVHDDSGDSGIELEDELFQGPVFAHNFVGIVLDRRANRRAVICKLCMDNLPSSGHITIQGTENGNHHVTTSAIFQEDPHYRPQHPTPLYTADQKLFPYRAFLFSIHTSPRVLGGQLALSQELPSGTYKIADNQGVTASQILATREHLFFE